MSNKFLKPFTKTSKYAGYTQAELFDVLQEKNPAIKNLVDTLQLELCDEETGEYASTSDLLKRVYRHANRTYQQVLETDGKLDIDIIFEEKDKLKNDSMSNEKKFGNKKPTANQTTNKGTDRAPDVYPEGMIIFTAGANAPDYILGDLVLNPETLLDWLNDNTDKSTTHEKYGAQFRFVIKRSKDGKLYLAVSQYKPKE